MLTRRGLLKIATDPAYVLLTEEGLEHACALQAGVEAVPLSAPEKPASSALPPETSPAQETRPPVVADEGEALPELRLNPIWERLPSYTKEQLEALYKRMECGLWTQVGDRFCTAFKKSEMLAYVQRIIRFNASLEAVQHLTHAQVDALFDWMRPRLSERFQRDDNLRIAARLYRDFLSVEEHGGLSPEVWKRYRDAEIRRIGSFCYHLFLEEKTGA